MRARSDVKWIRWAAVAAFGGVGLVTPAALSAQETTQKEVDTVLAQSVDFLLGEFEHWDITSPVLVSVEIGQSGALRTVADTIGLDAVSEMTGVPVWDGEEICVERDGGTELRMKNADFRITPQIERIANDTARVSIRFSRTLDHETIRFVELVRELTGWRVLNFVGPRINGTMDECTPGTNLQ